MAIFDDPKKDLEQLEKQLIAEEEWFRQELDSAKRMLGDKPAPTKKKPAPKSTPAQGSAPVRNYANGYGEEPKTSKKSPKAVKKEKSNKGLIILAVCETLGIVGIVAYWLLFFFG